MTPGGPIMTIIPQSGINWGFTPSDVITNAGKLVSGVSGFLLLILAFMIAPSLIDFLHSIFSDFHEDSS